MWGLFLLLHFSYETFPNTLFRIIGEEGETTFFHMKMLFFSYAFVTLAEFAIRRKRLPSAHGSASDFLASRALIAAAYPWLAITMWFSAEVKGIVMPNLTIELIFANVVTVVGIYLALRLEEVFDSASLRPSLKLLGAMVFGYALASYVAFSFKTPMPFFVTPTSFPGLGE